MDKIVTSLIEKREAIMGRNVRLFYDTPVHLIRGKGVHLWDANGTHYLDCYNNVAVIGHCHEKFIDALSKQLAELNTHTRYLHDKIIIYLNDLTSSFKAEFDAALLTCTGSEANDVALRTAWAVTGNRGIIATDHTYHGNTHLVSQLSKNKPPIGGHEPFMRHIPAPDSYRGVSAEQFAHNVENAILDLKKSGEGFAALILCPLFANEGFPTLPHGWLSATEKIVKQHQGVLICDEVQSGFGRTGTLWAHERIGVTPDIVTLGKPMAAGYPVGGVVTYRDYLNTFREAYSYFNTFAGSPVAVTAAQTTFDIIREEHLIENAESVGEYCFSKLRGLAARFDCIGDIRGAGLFFGAEFVSDTTLKTPDKARAHRLSNAMRHNGVLMSTLGIHYNTLKIRPPLVFSKHNADTLFQKLEQAIERDIA